jgi:hypothetical protein
MTLRLFISVGALAVLSLAPMRVAAQTSGKTWTPSLTPDGQPDLQGNWVNKSATPLERPEQLKDRQFLTDAEVVELKARADRNIYLAVLANVEQYKNPTPTTGGAEQMEEFEFDNRTSLIIDPPDGKLPPYTPAGQRRESALLAAIAMQNPPAGPADLTVFQRCITWGVPMPRPGPFTSFYQIVQSPGYAVIVMESIHDARIIPLDGRPHLPENIRTWNGDSVGRWEGKTLVVDTTNFSPKGNFLGSAENLHLIERFTRVAQDEIRYEFTVDDSTTWTKPWTAVLRLKQSQNQLYEVACHEGNFEVMEDMLKGARAQEKAAEEAAQRKPK